MEDLALSLEDFESLCNDGVLKPHAHHLTHLHVRLWNAAATPASRRASGDVEIEGFLPNSILRISGFKIKSEAALPEDGRKKESFGSDRELHW